MQPGRKSASNVIGLSASGARPRPTPPAFLSDAERTLFVELAVNNGHLSVTDTPLLAAYCQALSKVHKLVKKADAVADWERASRISMSLATKLRLTPQASTDPQSIGRRRADASPVSYYELMRARGDTDDPGTS